MKKSFTFLKVICVAILLSIMGISGVLHKDLELLISWTTFRKPRLKMNPALQTRQRIF